MGAEPWKYDIFTQPYDGMTPREKKGISSMVIHPQERVESAIEFLIQAFELHAQPMFQQMESYRQVIDDGMLHLRSVPCRFDLRGLECRIGYLFLLHLHFGGDNDELIALARKIVPPYRAADLEKTISSLQAFAASADPATFAL